MVLVNYRVYLCHTFLSSSTYVNHFTDANVKDEFCIMPLKQNITEYTFFFWPKQNILSFFFDRNRIYLVEITLEKNKGLSAIKLFIIFRLQILTFVLSLVQNVISFLLIFLTWIDYFSLI